MYGNISQILLLYKTWGYYNKFDSTKLLGVCYWCVKIPQYAFTGHGLKVITFYVQKHIAALEMCHNQQLVCDKPLGVPASVKLVYSGHFWCTIDVIYIYNELKSGLYLSQFNWKEVIIGASKGFMQISMLRHEHNCCDFAGDIFERLWLYFD